MQMIELSTGGRETTRLGFGCSSLMGALGRADSLAMLEAAYDAGLRHFDVAPSYGFGQAEECLGEFFSRHPGLCTVTTKFGIEPEAPATFKSVARGLVRPILKLLPGLKKNLQRAASSVQGASPERPEFSVEKARVSLERSLRALKVEHIDLWLLHEAEARDLSDDALLAFAHEAMTQGKIGAFGVGSGREKIAALQQERAAYCLVMQYEWSVLDALIARDAAFRIHHRALTENFRGLHAALRADAARSARWSDEVGADVADAETLAGLMLKASLMCNPGCVVLFSSKHATHMQKNAALVDDKQAGERALRLYALVRAEAQAAQGADVSETGDAA